MYKNLNCYKLENNCNCRQSLNLLYIFHAYFWWIFQKALILLLMLTMVFETEKLNHRFLAVPDMCCLNRKFGSKTKFRDKLSNMEVKKHISISTLIEIPVNFSQLRKKLITEFLSIWLSNIPCNSGSTCILYLWLSKTLIFLICSLQPQSFYTAFQINQICKINFLIWMQFRGQDWFNSSDYLTFVILPFVNEIIGHSSGW